MTIEEAIKKAGEQGYELPKKNNLVYYKHSKLVLHESQSAVCSTNDIFLDPLFWQSLGKAMEWNPNIGHDMDLKINWRYKWHRFIDHLADGKSIESFFENLN